MKRILRVLVAIGCLGLYLAAGPPASAQDDAPPADQFQVTTDYPFIAVEAGDTINVSLDVLAPTPQVASLAIIDPPTGWATTMRGGGFVIEGVTAAPVSPPGVELEIAVPPDASPGSYSMGVEGATEGGATSLLNLTLQVTDTPVGGIGLTTDFAVLEGSRDQTFAFNLQVTNQRPEELTIAFDAVGPEGWNVTASPASQAQATTVTVEPGASESVSVEATPSPTTAAGEYPIQVQATAGGQTDTTELTAIVTGQAALELAPISERLDMSGTAGGEATTTLLVTNTGSADLEGVELTAQPPADWTVEFEPAQLDSVPAGSAQEVVATVVPTGEAVAGDYVINITANSSSETSSLAYRFSVETSRWWGVLGVIIIIGALAGLFYVFRRYGRR